MSWLTHCLPRLDHTAAGGDHSVSDLLPALTVLYRAAEEKEGEKKKEKKKAGV